MRRGRWLLSRPGTESSPGCLFRTDKPRVRPPLSHIRSNPVRTRSFVDTTPASGHKRAVQPELSIVIPALNAASTLARTLDALGGPVAGRASEILVVDGGSSDGTARIAGMRGARVVKTAPGRGVQLAEGARRARGSWLLFLHADTVPEEGWAAAVAAHCGDPDNERRAAVFRFALDDRARAARRLEAIVAWRTRVLGLPYGDQGLLMSRAFYDALGGFRPLVLMEDVDIVRRIGRRRIDTLDVAAVTSAERYRRSGYLRRPARNLLCLGLYFLGVPPSAVARLYR